MKRHFGCLALAADGSLGRILAVLAAMAAAQAGVFTWFLRGDFVVYAEFAALFDGAAMRTISALALLALAALVSRPAAGGGYTARRLPVGRRWLAVWWTVYGLLVFALYWAVRLAVAFGLCRWFCARPEAGGLAGQADFLAFYQSAALHALLPLADTGRWWCAAMLYGGLGLSCGGAAAVQWTGGRNFAPLAVAAAAWLPAGGLGEPGWSIVLGAASLTAGLWSLAAVWKEEKP